MDWNASKAPMKRKTALKVTADEAETEDPVKEEPIALPGATNDSTNEPDASDVTEAVIKRRKKKNRRPTFSDTIPAIPVASFHRLAREMADNCRSDIRWEADALRALQVGAEAFMVEKFQKAGEMSDLFDRKTIGAELLRA